MAAPLRLCFALCAAPSGLGGDEIIGNLGLELRALHPRLFLAAPSGLNALDGVYSGDCTFSKDFSTVR